VSVVAARSTGAPEDRGDAADSGSRARFEGTSELEFGKVPASRRRTRNRKIPTIRRLLIENGTVRVTDRIRKLVLDEAQCADEAAIKALDSNSIAADAQRQAFRAQIHGRTAGQPGPIPI